MEPQIYRGAPEVKAEPTRRTVWSVGVIAALVVLTANTLLAGVFMSRGRFEVRVFAVATTIVAFTVVEAIKRVYAAWKKRHDAKLMLEWERRLEETK